MKKSKKKVETIWKPLESNEPTNEGLIWDSIIASVAITLGIILVFNWGQYVYEDHLKQHETQVKNAYRDGKYDMIQDIYRSKLFKSEIELQTCINSAQGK